jgi:endonuclease/exonuclease/phosphatase family metal-dependent hydrolase
MILNTCWPLPNPRTGVSLGMRNMSVMAMGCAFLLGCSQQGVPGTDTESERAVPVAGTEKVLDGAFTDWAPDEHAYADGRWVWLRFAPETRPTQAIQAAPYSTRIRIDADSDARTGASMEIPRVGDEAIQEAPQGVDVLIAFSPVNEEGRIGIGTGVTRFDADGNAEDIGHAGMGVACLPTYASEQYELRIDRLGAQSDALPESGPIEIIVDQVDEMGETQWSDRIVVQLPERDTQKQVIDAAMPERPAQGVRVMCANVLYSSPLTEPMAFKRVFDAIEPDVILYQEWFRAERDKVEAWIEQYAGADWSLHFPNERAGVAIATRHPILATYDEQVRLDGRDRSTRVCAALIDTDAGELLAISVHLKCCGSAGSEEDLTRIDQAQAINAFVNRVHATHPDAMVVIGGDYNLVGSRTPLAVMARGLGAQGDDLDPALTTVLGDPSVVTWVDEKSRFGPGRLDWLLYDDSRSELISALMLDTRVLSDGSLEAMGLEREDTMASDHLPLVVDLIRAN